MSGMRRKLEKRKSEPRSTSPCTHAALAGNELKKQNRVRDWIAIIWKDPVWSNVIAGAILVIASCIYGYIKLASAAPSSSSSVTGSSAMSVPAYIPDPPGLEVRDDIPFQGSFEAVKGMYLFNWRGVYDFINLTDAPITITQFTPKWPESSPNGLRLRIDALATVDVFDEAMAVHSFVLKNQTLRGLTHLNEELPVVIRPHTTEHLRFNFLIKVVSGETEMPFKRDAEGYRLIQKALGWDDRTYCDTQEIPVEISTGDGVIWSHDVPTFLAVPGCELYLPNPRGGVGK